MKKQLLIAYFASLSSLALIAQPNCGLWLNEVPLVADTAANTLYATLDPSIGTVLKATFRWDENKYSRVQIDDQLLENGVKDNAEVSNWMNNTTHTLTLTDNESHQWTLIFSTLPFLLVDCPMKEMSRTYSMTKGTEGHNKKFPGQS